MTALVVLGVLVLTVVVHCYVVTTPPPYVYNSTWVVLLEDGVHPSFIEDYGYEIVRKLEVQGFNLHLVRHTETHERQLISPTTPPSPHITAHLLSFPNVKLAEQQYLQLYYPRSFPDPPYLYQDQYTPSFPDPLFPDQWHLNNTSQFGGVKGVDASILNAWAMGYNGNGVRIAIVDDGYQTTHPDLAANYKADSSWSFNLPVGNSPDPNVNINFHGTAAAGVALAASNTWCGVGAAFNADGAGIRLIAGPVTDSTMASALVYKNQLNYIYSNSWGPSDNGIFVGGPGTATKMALKSGVNTGRGGLGSIFVWAAGNGAEAGDNCNYDGFIAARETIGVGAIGNNGIKAYYSEPCAALLIAAPSSSINPTAGIRTSDLVGSNGYDPTSCTSSFGGTSSACPLVAGVIALLLQANPKLTWRDVPYILATTATITDPTDSDWAMNGVGYPVNHKYGFGRINTTAAVLAALNHTNLDSQVVSSTGTIAVNKAIPDYYPNTTGITSYVTVMDIVTIEKVIITVTIDHPTSGDLQIVVTSPMGTQSVLSTPHAVLPAIYVNNSPQPVGTANFGSKVTSTPVTGMLAQVASALACDPPSNCAQLKGTIAFVQRGNCSFTSKASFVQACGAIAMVLANNDIANPDDPVPMDGSDPSITIPCVSVSYSLGLSMSSGMSVTLQTAQYLANNYASGWAMATVRCLGESSNGTWTIQVTDGFSGNTGTFNSFSLDIYGTGIVFSDDNASSALVAFVLVLGFAVVIGVMTVGAKFLYKKQGHLCGITFDRLNPFTPGYHRVSVQDN